jgi:hypothetical protein
MLGQNLFFRSPVADVVDLLDNIQPVHLLKAGRIGVQMYPRQIAAAEEWGAQATGAID